MANILIIEGDGLQSRLQMKGHHVEQAANGKEGIANALDGGYDMVLMDMHMPIMDGH